MTEQANAELIAKANAISTNDVVANPRRYRNLIVRLAAALEAADQRAAEYAAVVEKAEAFVTWHYPDTRFGDEVLPILASTGADVLREHDAALIGRLADEAGYFLVHHKEAVAFLRREARQRREEQA